MATLVQHPAPGGALLATAGDLLEVTLQLDRERAGCAFLRTNLGRAAEQRREIVLHTEEQQPFLARDWHDLPMIPVAPARFRVAVPLLDPGWFAAKACFIPQGSPTPEWPEGDNLTVKVLPAHAACANSLYTAFVRQFGPNRTRAKAGASETSLRALDRAGYTVIPPSGTFRALIRQLDTIIGRMGFRLLQLLPIHPVPTTYARMGRFGSPFANLDFLSVDPALAEFDRLTTPLDQFRELADAVHARGARLLIDLPANHTGWASTLQIHHPDWFHIESDGRFRSPGAWGTTWEDLVALDYHHNALRTYMAEVFLFWCRQGVDGFRCDAGYMIPFEIWRYIVACVRQQFPDTLFLLEGLGGKIEVTEQLLSAANLDWAYSEIFQVDDRAAFDRYLPGALALAARTGPLIHFAETHDNNRLAVHGVVQARLRTALAALLSHGGAFGVANGVEWFATAKIDVHGAAPLNWGAARNQVRELARLNRLLASHPAFAADARLRLLPGDGGNTLALTRIAAAVGADPLLILVNLDARRTQSISWPTGEFAAAAAWDLLSGGRRVPASAAGRHHLTLAAGEVCCLTADRGALLSLRRELRAGFREPDALLRRRRALLALRVRRWLGGHDTWSGQDDPWLAGDALAADPLAYCARCAEVTLADEGAAPDAPPLPPVSTWNWPADARRVVMLPPGNLLLLRVPHPFRARLERDGRVCHAAESLPLDDGTQATLLHLEAADAAPTADGDPATLLLRLDLFAPDGTQHLAAPLLALTPASAAAAVLRVDGPTLRAEGPCALLTNGRGAMALVRARWGELRSQYDALLAVNPDPRVPVDRRVFFTRCRAWVVHCGYSQAIDAACTLAFEADPGGTQAAWSFQVPAGMGRRVALRFALRMTRLHNRVVINLTREPGAAAPDALDDDTPIRVVLRPDIEARNFHQKTKAFSGPEQAWPAAVQTLADGFAFQPANDERYTLRTDVGSYHAAPEWSYQVAHPEDAARGLDGASDLFSPGWFEIELRANQRAHLTAAADEPAPAPAVEALTVRPLTPREPLPGALARALDAFIVRRDTRRTVIAGYPWFLDWGRDTLIALRGLIAAGRTAEALDILSEFGRLESHGTLPNMIRGNDASNRDTVDAPLWFAVAARDLIGRLGAPAVLEARCGDRPLRDVLLSIARHYRDGTPNGIRVEGLSGLVYSPPHFTWMDTNYPAATPRAGYPVDVQALWIATLTVLRQALGSNEFVVLEQRARTSLATRFALPEGWLADCLRAEPGQPAAEATPEDALRPNQLLAITLGALDDHPLLARGVLHACECLLVPGAIRSLADRPVRTPLPVTFGGRALNDPHRPYWGRYEGDEDTRRKPAYHNGTAWSWLFPSYCEALLRVYGAAARPTAQALLGSATAILNHGCLGHTPEIVDGDAPHTPRGCVAQAWGASELLRVWLLCAAADEPAGQA